MTATTRIDTRFKALAAEGRAGLVTFITGGDPDYDTSLAILKALPKAGADIIEVGVPFTDVPRARVFAEPAPAARRYAVIHPAAAMPYKTWRPEGFLAVAGHIERNLGLEPVFIGAAGDDLTPFARYRLEAGRPLAQLKSLLAGASLFVGNDSGPAHIACALGVPVVVLFGRPEHQVVWAPWRPVAARTLVSPAGISAIAAADVMAAVDELAR